jgi:osmotically-inducible protein OsmY
MRIRHLPDVAGVLCLASVLAVASPVFSAQSRPSQSRAAASQTVQRPSDETLRTRVQAAISSARDLPGRQIEVAVKDGTVSLTGIVGSTIELQSLGAVVRAVPAVRDVKFSVKVQPPPRPPAPGAAPGR